MDVYLQISSHAIKYAYKLNYSFIHLFIISLFSDFFTPADSFPLDSERQQVSSNLQDSSQYCSRSQQCCCLDGLHFSSNFQVSQSL